MCSSSSSGFPERNQGREGRPGVEWKISISMGISIREIATGEQDKEEIVQESGLGKAETT